jgi:DNA-binding NtrC family response regulator
MNTILYISEQAAGNKPLVDALKCVGYDVVTTSSPSQAVALLFLMYSAAGVVLSRHLTQHASFDVAHSLRTVCPQIPIILLCDGAVEPTPCVDSCLGTEEPLEKLVEAVRRVLEGNQVSGRRCR